VSLLRCSDVSFGSKPAVTALQHCRLLHLD
jgi:hypothetical protein